jgi:hypothetical protein
MMRRAGVVLGISVLFCAVSAVAQTGTPKTNTITVRVLNGKTGKLVSPTNLLVRINKQAPIHSDWVRQNDDATGFVTLPVTAKVVSIEAAYDESTAIYVNCDPTPLDYPGERRWYPVQAILQSGLAVADGCQKHKKGHETIKATAKPGEFIFYVRERKRGDPEVN